MAQVITDLPILSGFDAADQTAEPNTDELEFQECTQTSGTTCTATTDSRVRIQTGRVHDGGNEDGVLNTGDLNTSHWAGLSTITSATNAGYYQLFQAFNPRPQTIAVGMSFNVETPPAAGTTRTILALVETNATDLGCAVAIDSNRQLTLFYASGTSGGTPPCAAGYTAQGGQCWQTWGTTTAALTKRACSTDVQKACTTGADCVSGVCSTTNYYWGGVELGEIIGGPNDVTCELYIDGVPMFTGTQKTIAGTNAVQSVSNVEFGAVNAPGTSTGTGTIYFDDLVLVDHGRAGYGYVAAKTPATSGGLTQWALQTAATCTTTNRVACAQDYATSPFLYYSDATTHCYQKNVVGKRESWPTSQPMLQIPGDGATVEAIEGVVLGSTTVGSGARYMETRLILGASGFEVTTGNQNILASGNATSPRQWSRLAIDASPVQGETLLDQVNKLGLAVVTGTGNTDTIRVGAIVFYVRVRKPDITGPRTLTDRNGDGLVTIALWGDSTLTGTLQVKCVGGSSEGTQCSEKDYCSWAPFHDLPVGGCGGDNTPDLELMGRAGVERSADQGRLTRHGNADALDQHEQEHDEVAVGLDPAVDRVGREEEAESHAYISPDAHQRCVRSNR